MTTTTTGSTTRTYKIDRAHSEAVFQVRHLVTKVRGRFDDFDGIGPDQRGQARSVVRGVHHPGGEHRHQRERSRHAPALGRLLRRREVSGHHLRSKRIVKKSSESYDVTGDLTIRGVTKEIALPVTHLGKAKDPCGTSASGSSPRSRSTAKTMA